MDIVLINYGSVKGLLMILTLDIECTTSNKGNPRDLTNKLVAIAVGLDDNFRCFAPEKLPVDWLQRKINEADVILGFNFKFDMAWLRKFGVTFENKKIWDCQLADFIWNRQETPYPSLNGCAEKYGLGSKLDVIATEYWDKGINTDAIPWGILSEYAVQDIRLTKQLYDYQFERMPQHMKKLVHISGYDQQVLHEMEWNGLKIDEEKSLRLAEELDNRVEEIKKQFNTFSKHPDFNWSSNNHLSALLFGGSIPVVEKEPDGVFKTGLRKGQVKFKNVKKEIKFPRMYKPAKGTERMDKEGNPSGLYSVDEPSLVKIGKGELIDGILEIKKLEKQNSTYYRGLPTLIKEFNWTPGMIYGTFNQCVARTGRLSSKSPNLQNLSEDTQVIFTTRYL